MAGFRLSFTERRRARLAKQVDRLERLETRNTITEPISFTGMSLSVFRGLAMLGVPQVNGGSAGGHLGAQPGADRAGHGQAGPSNGVQPRFPGSADDFLAIAIEPHVKAAGGGGGAASNGVLANTTQPNQADDWLTLFPTSSSDQSGISTPWHPVSRGGDGGLGVGRRAGRRRPRSPCSAARSRLCACRHPRRPAAARAGAAGSAALLAAVASANSQQAGPITPLSASFASSNHASGGPLPIQSAALQSAANSASLLSGGSSSHPISLTPSGASGPSQEVFPYFPLYVLDVNDGVVLFPGVTQLGQVGGSVVLQAQVSGTTVSSYNWNTTGLPATSITGSSTYQLSFQWEDTAVNNVATSVTLSVEDSNSHFETYTYDFELLSGSTGGGGGSGGGGSGGGSGGGGITTMTWPLTYSPDTVSPDAPEWQSHGASVNADSGALDTAINLPSYNPTVPALAPDL